MATIVMCHMSICHMAAGNVNELLFFGYMCKVLPTIDVDIRDMSYVNVPYIGG